MIKYTHEFEDMSFMLDCLCGLILSAEIMLLDCPLTDKLQSQNAGAWCLSIASELAQQALEQS